MPRSKTLLVWIPFLLSVSAIFALHWQINIEPPIAKSAFRVSLTQVSLVPVFLLFVPVLAWIYAQMWRRFLTPGPELPPAQDFPIPAEVLLRAMPFLTPMPGMPDLSRPPVREEEGTGQDEDAAQVEYVVIRLVRVEVIPVPMLPRARPQSGWRNFADGVVSFVVSLMIVFYVVTLVLGLFDAASHRDHELAGLYLVFQLVLGAVTLGLWRRRRSNRNQTPPAVRTQS